jgi:cyclic-di-GMP-binding biofilm dispersal mediator protein
MNTDFEGKNVLVLGGSRGIGAAIVKRFAASGATVAFTYSGSADAAQVVAQETGAITLRADSADRNEVIDVVAGRGALDVLVVNAGIFIAGDPLDMDPDAVDRMIDVNVRAPYHAAVEAARRMNDDGRIVVIGSVNGDRMPAPGAAAYAMTKSAVQGMVRGLARDFGHRGITVNAVQPGPTDSEMNPADGPMADAMHGFMAIKRHARVDEVAELTAFIAGPHAGMITGSMQTIDGGFGA